MKTKKKYWIPIVFIMILLVAVAIMFVFSFLGFFFFGRIYPRDAKIFDTLYENEEMLLGIDGVKAEGIEYENNRPIGIKVYACVR